ncbi:MAG: molybdopterin molybdotransferase MoeA [Hyphomicrobiaceae bacterium]|nr:molybdopterin molybdotransferase MoeA [Hyphomicrobiaceae bacterium]
MPPKLIDDCFRPGTERMAHADAIALLKSRVHPIAATETVALAQAAGRVLAGSVTAERAVPAHTNAAVDGFAFDHSTYRLAAARPMPVAGRAAAGRPLVAAVTPGLAARILTGAVLPDGTDTVAMQEDVEVNADGTVVIPAGLKPGANVRLAGEDVSVGQTLLQAGRVLRPQDLAALASIGRDEVTCHKRLRVGIVSTGDEIVRVGQRALGAGDVYDANAPMLTALIQAAGAEPVDLGVWPDRREDIATRLAGAAPAVDVMITSGGASRGDEDHMAAAIDAIGERHFWQLAIKPGRPMMLGRVGETAVIGLPGNPVAVFVCFLMYAYPLLRRLGGADWIEPRRYMLPAAFEIASRKTGRREFWRSMLVGGGDGASLAADKFARDGSGLISGLCAADGLIDIGEDVAAVRRGDPVAFIPLSEFGIPRG